MECIVAHVDHIKFDIEVALDEQYGALPLPFPGMDSEFKIHFLTFLNTFFTQNPSLLSANSTHRQLVVSKAPNVRFGTSAVIGLSYASTGCGVYARKAINVNSSTNTI